MIAIEAQLQERVICDLADHLDAMDKLMSVYVRRLVSEAVDGRGRLPQQPGLHPLMARLCREFVDEHVVQAIGRGELRRNGAAVAGTVEQRR